MNLRLRSTGPLLATAIALTFGFATKESRATSLPPGSTVTPDAQADPSTTPGFMTLTTITGTFDTGAFGTIRETGTFTESVVKETSGNLDFVYKFSNDATSSNALERVSMADYLNFTTDAGYVAGTGDVIPNAATRTVAGHVVGFNFTGSSDVQPGQSSDLLVIRTNAQQYGIGTYTFQDGATATVSAFSPRATATPEPSTLATAALGTLCLIGFARRRRQASA